MKEIERIRQMSSRELALFGMQDLAYVKPVVVDGASAFFRLAPAETEPEALYALLKHLLRLPVASL